MHSSCSLSKYFWNRFTYSVNLTVFYFIFNWRIITLQYCDGFCHTSTWISHRHTHVPSLLNLPPYSMPLGCHRAPALDFLCHAANSHWLSILHMAMYMSQVIPPSPSPTMILCLHLLCCTVSRIISTIFLDSIYIASIQYLSSFFWVHSV